MNLPNAITLGRLLAVPLVVWLMLSRYDTSAFVLFRISCFSRSPSLV